MTEAIREKWQQVALEIGHRVHRAVNTPGDDETGYVLMFFNARNHRGKSTLVSSAVDRAELKRLLKTAIRELDGPKTKIVTPDKYPH